MAKLKRFMVLLLIPLLAFCSIWSSAYADAPAAPAAAEPLPAFPGAEGGGMYTTGGRGGEVYEVTTLADSGPGSLRDAVSQGNRTVVFRVSGNIDLKSKLYIRGSNLTIAGQTAPGDGITVNHYPAIVEADNLIIRHMRFRLGDTVLAEEDAMSIRKYRNIIMDHCSFSWAIDEVLSPYENANVTVQWSIIGEALHMSRHQKGRHGFGGLWGAGNSTYHHNLLIHNASRNARYKGTLTESKTLDFRNNVIYNWNYQTSYGGDHADVNIINNYYKYGPDTLLTKRRLLYELTGANGQVYANGNYIDSAPDVTADNWLGIFMDAGKERINEPLPVNPVTTHSAEEAYELVLAQAGANVPRRDAVDSRMVNDVRDRTGREINSQTEVGGWPELNSLPAPADSDHDGMPDSWELEQGLNPNDPADRNGVLTPNGYTHLERYLNSIVWDGKQNPKVRMTSPALNTVMKAGKSLTMKADASDPDGSVAKVQFFANDVLLGEDSKKPYSFDWNNVPDGSYFLRARAIDRDGLVTDSSTVPVHVNTQGNTAPWTSRDVGKPDIKGHVTVTDGRIVVKGSGNWREDDTFHIAYQKLKGDGAIVARIDQITNTAPHNRAGVMIRESLNPLSREAMMALSVRGEAYVGVFYSRDTAGQPLAETPPVVALRTPYWVKLEKTGDVVSGYLSRDGMNWTFISSAAYPGMNEVYIGLAAEAGEENNLINNYNTSVFTGVSLSGPPTVTLDQQDQTVTSAVYTVSGTISEPGTVKVDGKRAVVDSSLRFSAEVHLKKGLNKITVQAVDTDGNKSVPYVLKLTRTTGKPGHSAAQAGMPDPEEALDEPIAQIEPEAASDEAGWEPGPEEPGEDDAESDSNPVVSGAEE
ncbi:Ig-like domain-containing protein [Paenibacillus sp. y28]|uniref:Ig-like domain-containing protein n=1 Tax=Paenibacillus sp. y28 TaxID=3129110 RepID=UPI0030194B39